MPERLAPGVHLLDLGWPAPLGANAFLVENGAVTLVDAGLPLNASRIRTEIDRAGFDVADIDRVLLTHYDLDHVGGLSRLVPDLDAPVYVGETDLGLLDGSWTPPLLHHKGLFHRATRRLYRLPRGLRFEPVADGDRIGGFTAYHTPGHNPGHTVFFEEELGAGFLGDLVWEDGGRLTTPIWLDSYDMDAVAESVRRLAGVAPAFEVAAMGHGTPLRTGGLAALRDLAGRVHAESRWLP